MASPTTIMLWTAQSISLSASLYSPLIHLGAWSDIHGWFSLHVELSGDGTGKFQVAVSNNKTNYIVSATASDDIVTAHTKTSGPGTDGTQIYQFSAITAEWIKIKVTETGGANAIVVGAWLAIH